MAQFLMDIGAYIKSEENRYNTIPIPIVENYEWHMAQHVKLTTLYLNSRYETGDQDNKPFKNIILPKINLEHRAVEFAVREIDFFVDDAEEYYKSFLVRKYHEKWARQNDLAGFLDDLTETYTDYGGVLVEKLKDSVPNVVPFQSLAFVDQTDIMKGPICKKLQFSPDELMEMEAKGWKNINEIITLAKNSKTTTQVNGKIIETPMKYIEVYDLYGSLPAKYLDKGEEGDNVQEDENKYVTQLQVVGFYKDQTGTDQHITLYSGKAKKGRYKFYKRDKIFGRALGRGGVEELFEPQVWVNHNEIQKKEMLDQASKILYQTADKQFHTRNNTSEMEQGEILVNDEGKPLSRVDNSAYNVTAFENALERWDNTAKEISASFDTISGADTKSGLPFRLGLLLNQEAHSLHQYRKGKIGGQFLPEIYRDWIIPDFQMKLTSEDNEFMTNLSLEEMSELAEQVVTATVNKAITQKILGGNVIEYGEVEALSQSYKDLFYKKGNKKFLKIFKDDMKGLPIDIEVNITGEEKNKALMAEKLSSVFTQIAQNPALLDDPRMSKLFNEILESSGLSPLAYSTKKAPVVSPIQPNTTGGGGLPVTIPPTGEPAVVA